MSDQPGYPLPDGPLGEDDIVCQLVYLPDRPEYWQAFLGALHYMTTWRAWERDTDKRGKDAAANWRAAFEQTIGCWRMTCLQDLQDDVAAILAIMQMGNSCCIDQDPTDGDQFTDRVTDGVGDVPQNVIDAGYADDAADWDGFDDYKCMIVHVTVNQMEQRLREISEVVSPYGAIFGGVAALAVMLGLIATVPGLVIVTGIIAAVGSVSLLYAAIIEFDLIDDLADDVATNHDELACAMYDSDGDEGALVALNDKIDELFTVAEAVILKNLNNGPTLKALYSGRYDQQDIAAELEEAGYELDDFDCECIEGGIGEYQILSNWDGGAEADWTLHLVTIDATEGNPIHSLRQPTNVSCYARMTSNQMRTRVGLSTDPSKYVDIHKITFDYKAHPSTAAVQHMQVGITDFTYGKPTTWTHIERTWDPPKRVMGGYSALEFHPSQISGNPLHVDNVWIDFDAPA